MKGYRNIILNLLLLIACFFIGGAILIQFDLKLLAGYFFDLAVSLVAAITTLYFVDKYIKDEEVKRFEKIESNIKTDIQNYYQSMATLILTPLNLYGLNFNVKTGQIIEEMRSVRDVVGNINTEDIESKIVNMREYQIRSIYDNLQLLRAELYQKLILYKDYLPAEWLEQIFAIWSILDIVYKFFEMAVNEANPETKKIILSLASSGLEKYFEELKRFAVLVEK